MNVTWISCSLLPLPKTRNINEKSMEESEERREREKEKRITFTKDSLHQDYSRCNRDQASDSNEVVIPLMLDGTYLSRNFATLGPTF